MVIWMKTHKPPTYTDDSSDDYFAWWNVKCSKCNHSRYYHTNTLKTVNRGPCVYAAYKSDLTTCNCIDFSNFEEMISNLTLKENEDEEDNDVLDLAFEPNKLNICH